MEELCLWLEFGIRKPLIPWEIMQKKKKKTVSDECNVNTLANLGMQLFYIKLPLKWCRVTKQNGNRLYRRCKKEIYNFKFDKALLFN